MAEAAKVARQAANNGFAPPSVKAAEDDLLMRRVAEGDRVALQQAYTRFHRPVVAYLVRLVRDHAVAEELASEVMIGIWRQAARYEGRSSLETWVFGIAHHKAVSWLRKRRDEGMAEGTADALVDERPDPEENADERSVAGLMARLIERLPAEQRAALQLTYYQDMPLEAVAATMNCPVNTVKTRMYYARQHLKKMLASEGITALAA